MNRRQLLASGAAVSVAALGLPGTALAQETRLRYYFWGGPGRSDRKLETTYKFAASQKDLVVDGEWSPWGDYWPRLATQIAGGNPPDLIQMDYRYIFEYARRGVLRPLDDLYPNIIQATDFGDQRIDSGRVDGKLYGITIGDNALGFGYSADAWSAAGLELSNDLTWASFKDLCAQFAKANTKPNYFATNNSGGHEPTLEIWLRQKGKALYTADGLGFEAADAAEWFAYWLTMSQEGLAPPADVQALQQPNPENNLISLGLVATSPMWSNEVNPIGKLVQFRLEIVPVPKQDAGGKSGAYLKPSQFMSVSAASPAPERAAEVINYLTNSLDAFKDLGVETAIPPSAKVREQIVPFLDETAKKSLAYVELIGGRADPLPIPPPSGAGEIQQLLADTHLQVLFGNVSPEQGGTQFVQVAEAALERT